MNQNPEKRNFYYGYRAVGTLLGLLLLAAAGLKAHELLTSPVAQTILPGSPWFHVALIEGELLVGLWLISGVNARGSWVVALLLFSALGCASLYLAAVVQSASCGCFGRLSVNPWYTFGFDLAAVAALVWWRPRQFPPKGTPLWLQPRQLLTTGGGAAALLAAMFGTLTWLYGSPYEGLARLRNEPITVEPRVADLGTVVRGEPRHFTIAARNHTNHPIRIVGGSADCSCIATEDLPLEVPAREERTLRIRLQYKGSPGTLQRPFNLFYASAETQSVLVAWVSAAIVEPPER